MLLQKPVGHIFKVSPVQDPLAGIWTCVKKESVSLNESDCAGCQAGNYLWSLSVLEATGFEISRSSRILDFGCGAGDCVEELVRAGYEVEGADIAFKFGEHRDPLLAKGLLHKIPTNPYRLPFDDSTFDVVLSFEVMEHVMDYRTALTEIRRVLKPNGRYFCMFPSRLGIWEPHVFVPLAGVVRSLPYLLFWSLLGVRAPHQAGLKVKERALENFQYLKEETNYPTWREIRSAFHTSDFSNVDNIEDLFLKNSPNERGRTLERIGRRLPIVYSLYRTFWARVIVAY